MSLAAISWAGELELWPEDWYGLYITLYGSNA